MLDAERREIKRPGETEGVIFVLYKDGKVLVEERIKKDSAYYGHVRFPGGEIEKGEIPSQAVIREVTEELGVQARNLIPLDSFEDVTLNGGYFRFHAFLVTGFDGEVRNQEPDKSVIHWLPLGEARTSLKLASSRLVLNLVEQYLTSVKLYTG